MKKLSFLFISLTIFIYSCSSNDDDTTTPPNVVLTPDTEPENTQYTLTVSSGEGGTVSTQGGTYDEGTEVTITATPDEGYVFNGWNGTNNDLRNLSLTLNSNLNIEALFTEIIPFVSKSPIYSFINQTTSEYYSQFFFKKYMTRDTHESLFWDKSNIRYMIQEVDGVYNDFDNNNTLDFFGFAYWSNKNNGEWGTNPGKYVLIKDFFYHNREKIIFDTQVSFGGKMNLNDYDNDGILDVLNFSYNTHQNEVNAYNSSLSELPVEYIKIDGNLNYSKKFVGPTIMSHDGCSGDIDNDGDIDILLISLNDNNLNRESIYPIVLENSGNGEFLQRNAFQDNQNFISLNSVYMSEFNDYESLHYNLFDLNNDGNLDIISGFNIESNDPYVNREREGIDIFWGDGSGEFLTSNSTKIYANDLSGYQYSLLGTSYLDFDNDGDLDIFSVSTRAESAHYVSQGGVVDSGSNFYENYAIHLFENINGNFQDVTNTYIDSNKDLSKTKFSHFYDLNFKDVDDDGDYDLIPSKTSGFFTFPQLNNLFWENTNGFFRIRELGGYNNTQ